MATAITHLALLEYLFDGRVLHCEFGPAALGTIFPDIRYLASIPRERLHFARVSPQQILQESDSFKVGMMLHSYVDLLRDRYWLERDFYRLFAERSIISALKFVEDEMFYYDLRRTGTYRRFLAGDYPSFDNHGINVTTVRQWNDLCWSYCTQTPTEQTRYEKLSSLKFTRDSIIYLQNLMQKIKHSPEALKYVREFHTTFPKQLREYLLEGVEATCDYSEFDNLDFSAP